MDETGCWAAYGTDYGYYLLSVHPSEVEALRAVVLYYGTGAVFLPWNTSLAEAIEQSGGSS